MDYRAEISGSAEPLKGHAKVEAAPEVHAVGMRIGGDDDPARKLLIEYHKTRGKPLKVNRIGTRRFTTDPLGKDSRESRLGFPS